MNQVRKTTTFLQDLARSADWHLENADPEVALRFINAVEETVSQIGLRPWSGKIPYPRHPRLGAQRRVLLPSPFQNWLVFYSLAGDTVVIAASSMARATCRGGCLIPNPEAMMNLNPIRERLHRGFSPFIITTTHGRTFEVPHPDCLAVGKGVVVVLREDDTSVKIDACT